LGLLKAWGCGGHSSHKKKKAYVAPQAASAAAAALYVTDRVAEWA